MAITKQTSSELKTRVNNCLNKLSDRDTLSIATNELETIARQLQNDCFAPFLNCLSATDSSDKSPVRRQSVRLIGILSAAHGDAMSPHLSLMISTVIRRLRDPDSAVRAACVDAVASITTHVSSPASFNIILKPLVVALFQEQELNAQIGASLCLSAAVDAAAEVDVTELRKLLPRILKLVKSECFKGKPSLLLCIGSIMGTGCVKSKGLLNSLISTAIEFLGSEDWAARKAAAEVLEKVAVAERDLVLEFKVSSMASLESRRFDKVKVVRETMNRALGMWKDVPGLSEEEASSPKDSSINGHSLTPLLRSSIHTGLKTPQTKKLISSKSSASSCSSSSSSLTSVIRSKDKKSCTTPSNASKLNLRKNFRTRVQVVPFNCTDDNSDMADGNIFKDEIVGKIELDGLSLIRKQLLQIENQQSNLFNLLQKFIGNSQKGMSYLEKRVDSLEKVLDEISKGMPISTRRISDTDSGGNACCMIPGAEFLSPKYWRKTEGHSKFNSPFKSQFLNTNIEISLVDSPRN